MSDSDPTPAPARHRSSPMPMVRKGLRWLASLVKLIMWLIVLVLVLYVVFNVGGANPANWLTMLVTDWAQRLNLGLDTLFMLPDPRLTVTLNYLVVAVIWLIIGSIVTKVLRRI